MKLTDALRLIYPKGPSGYRVMFYRLDGNNTRHDGFPAPDEPPLLCWSCAQNLAEYFVEVAPDDVLGVQVCDDAWRPIGSMVFPVRPAQGEMPEITV